MEIPLIVLGCVFFLLVLHPLTTYPLSLVVLGRLRPRAITASPQAMSAGRPKAALCVCAYNEAHVIRAKAENMLAMRAAMPDLELLIYVDAATDGTADILQEYAGRITVVVSPTRNGKTHGMNTLVARTKADFIIFSDANVSFAPDAIPRLLRPFADPGVGCVCGHLIYVAPRPSATASIGSVYWRLEERIKELESRTGSVMGADGSIFAIRRALHRPPPPDIIDDLYVSLSIMCDGHRIVRVDDAIAYEAAVSKSREEFRRKVRIGCQAFNVHCQLRPRLRDLGMLDRYKYTSHKLLRWLSAFWIIGGTLALLGGLAVMQVWWVFGVGAVALGGLLLGAWLWPAGPFGMLLESLGAFIATGLGVLRSLQGERFQIWAPPVSTRTLLKSQ